MWVLWRRQRIWRRQRQTVLGSLRRTRLRHYIMILFGLLNSLSHGRCIRIFEIFIMMTSSNGNIFRVTGAFCGEFTGPGEFPAQRPVTRSFDVFFDLPLNERLSKQSWGWWFETPYRPLWRHRNVLNSINFPSSISQVWMSKILSQHWFRQWLGVEVVTWTFNNSPLSLNLFVMNVSWFKQQFHKINEKDF